MKKIKTMAFLVEPSSYTLDLVEHVYRPMKIDYLFLNDAPLIAHADKRSESQALAGMSWLQKLFLLMKVRENYDLIIFNGYNYPEFILLFVANLLLPKKNIIAIESDTQTKEDNGLKGVVKRIFLETIFKNSRILGFAGGGFTHKELFRKYGMKEERIFLMPLMVNNERFMKKSRNDCAHESTFTFLYVGRIIPHKNVEMLIQSFLNAFGNRKDVRLRLVGKGESMESLERMYGKYPNILFEGAKFGDDLVKAYHTSHALVIPSLYEPWGLVVNEALSAGLPVVASNRVGAIHDLVEGKDTGFVFDPEDRDELSVLLRKIHEDKVLYRRLSSNAADLMKNHWNYDLYQKNLKQAIKYAEKLLRIEQR
jgi:glycosyltransferase involved in cell wall biosynthesis